MLTTQCPNCSTAFRVTPEQLKTRAGKVRCGQCNGVFNALENLQDAAPPAPVAAAEPAPTAEQPTPVEAEAAPASETAAEASQEQIASTESIDILLEDIAGQAPPKPRWPAFAWAAATSLALALMLAQAAYLLRAELAVSQPELRPLLQEMCGLLDCDIPLPRKADLVSIEASDLHPDPQRLKLLVLAATLKNRAPFVQAYPHLELTLTDVRDQPVIRRVFAPADYLGEGIDVAAGFAANADLPVNLWLDAGDSGASGYRLYLFYP